MSAPELLHDTAAAVDFLSRWHGGERVVLTSIIPDGETTTRTFENADDPALPAWIEARQGIENLYFGVNALRRAVSSKSSKGDVDRLVALHVDVDPRVGEDHEAERSRILKMMREAKPAFSVIIDSGGGFQGFYKLQPEDKLKIGGSVAKAQELEAYNIQLERLFGADSCHNADRIMRLPGSWNVPNARKLKKGRKKTVARVIEFNDLIYPITAFTPAMRVQQSSPGLSVGQPEFQIPRNVDVVGTDELRKWAKENGTVISERALAIVAGGADPIEPGKHPSRSEAQHYVTCELVRCGVPPEMIYAVITGPNLIAESVREKRDWKAYARRQIERAIEQAAGPRWDCTDKHGNPLRSYPNTVEALKALNIECSHDLFRNRNLVGHHELQEFAGEFSDQAESILRREVRMKFGFDPGKENVKDAVLELCTQYRFDSLVDHLNALPAWDGVERLEKWLPVYLGAENSPYTRGAGSAWLLAAIARAMQPGTKFDHMLVLIGSQGVGKSTALRMLAGDDLYTDANFLGAKDTREVLEATTGAWIVECAELAGMRHKDTETLKYEITKQEDKGRHAYARNPVTVPRRFVLAGTTNSARFLHDDTGNRRFWPVEVKRVDFAALKRDRDQLLAEALARFRSGQFQLFLSGEAAVGAEREQGNRHAVDLEYFEVLQRLEGDVVDDQGHALCGLEVVSNDDVYGLLGIQPDRRRGHVGMEVRRAMTALGWQAQETSLWWPIKIDPNGAQIRRKHRVYTRPASGRLASSAPSTSEARGDEGCPF